MLQSIGSQRAGHDLVTEQQQASGTAGGNIAGMSLVHAVTVSINICVIKAMVFQWSYLDVRVGV